MADEKKIFLAYVYRCLNVLYSHLYKQRAHLVIDGIVAHEEDKQCCYAYIPATPLGSLALHSYGVYRVCELYDNAPKLPLVQQHFISLLINGQLPSINDAIKANIINVNIDRYNPIFATYNLDVLL